MIIVRLIGGLGNQLFQYALGRQISSKNNTELKMDISGYQSYPLRSYLLGKFNIIENIATKDEVTCFLEYNIELNRKELRKLRNLSGLLVPYYKRKYVKERSTFFDLNVLKIKDDAYLDGYWASEKYFKDIASVIRKEFTVKEKMNPVNQELAETIRDTESVSVHFRRGDYVTNPITNAYHGTCSLNYYHTAVDDICKEVSEPHFFIFSDDPDWVKQNFFLPYPVEFVTANNTDNPQDDLRLMSLCRHHIIANSSFSWWGAWLGGNQNKKVYCPKMWFNIAYDTRNLIPDEWTQI